MIRSKSLLDRLHLLACVGATLCVALPTTVLLPLPLTRLFFRRYRREEMLQRLHRMAAWARFCVRWIFGVQLHVTGQEHLVRPRKGCLIICNHQSIADIPVLAAALDTAAFLAKRSVRRYPVIGSCAYAGGSVFVDRLSMDDRKRALKETIRMCLESTAVIVFPEGTTSCDGDLLERVHYSCLKRAHEVGLKVLPVALHGTYRVLGPEMERLSRGEVVAVRIGEALDPAGYEDAQAFAERCWQAVADQHALAKEFVEGGSWSTSGLHCEDDHDS